MICSSRLNKILFFVLFLFSQPFSHISASQIDFFFFLRIMLAQLIKSYCVEDKFHYEKYYHLLVLMMSVILIILIWSDMICRIASMTKRWWL